MGRVAEPGVQSWPLGAIERDLQNLVTGGGQDRGQAKTQVRVVQIRCCSVEQLLG